MEWWWIYSISLRINYLRKDIVIKEMMKWLLSKTKKVVKHICARLICMWFFVKIKYSLKLRTFLKGELRSYLFRKDLWKRLKLKRGEVHIYIPQIKMLNAKRLAMHIDYLITVSLIIDGKSKHFKTDSIQPSLFILLKAL